MLCDELESEKTCKASQKEIGTRNIFRNSSDEKKKKIVQKRKPVSRDSYSTKKKAHGFFPGSKCGGRVTTTESCVYAFLSFSLKKICALRAL